MFPIRVRRVAFERRSSLVQQRDVLIFVVLSHPPLFCSLDCFVFVRVVSVNRSFIRRPLFYEKLGSPYREEGMRLRCVSNSRKKWRIKLTEVKKETGRKGSKPTKRQIQKQQNWEWRYQCRIIEAPPSCFPRQNKWMQSESHKSVAEKHIGRLKWLNG